MHASSLDAIVNAQSILMQEHDVSSETALGLLVWAATDRGVTVLEVALSICGSRPQSRSADVPLRASA
ncbi:hypothetical protein ASC61_14475 [Aeromicrobium sp. Root344]|uniref:ANTAR domain-containing protein n=1 Tax=Aeromicrobium sp. Root344 TaxID=1736521 RepID=UPI0006FB3C34|nr:ANTAR domain-containing protein [Aeromicrobium sp. Root344]KQV76112.1 hypothetical protein ASC61_14475 [Aeromicrobium sp. Root344]